MPSWPLVLRTGILRPSGQTQTFSVYGPFSLLTQRAKLSRIAFCRAAVISGARNAPAGLANPKPIPSTNIPSSSRTRVLLHRPRPDAGDGSPLTLLLDQGLTSPIWWADDSAAQRACR